ARRWLRARRGPDGARGRLSHRRPVAPPTAERGAERGARRVAEASLARMPGMSAPLVVQKFGGSSLADADRIRRVARRIARERARGSQLVVVVSAMGDTTDELIGLARAITDEPDSRELDVLLA